MSAVVSFWTPLGANSAPPEPIGFTGLKGAYFLLNTNLSLAKNNAVLSLGQTNGHYHDSLKYTLKIQLYEKLQ